MLLDRLAGPVRGVRIVRHPFDSTAESNIGAQIVPHRQLTQTEVSRLLQQLEDVDGAIVTSALSTREQTPFREIGFSDREDLYLLQHNMTGLPNRVATAHRLRGGRRSDLSTVLEIDRASFEKFWALDRDALHAARRATPVHRYRVAVLDRRVVGYAITGRAGRSSFLQRLGVDPRMRSRGIGTDLVRDSLEWARGEGATSMLVNTQTKNQRARRLYEELGFALSEERLMVLQWNRDR